MVLEGEVLIVDSYRLSSSKPLSKPVSFSDIDTLRVALTVQEGSSAKRPHQAFLLLSDAQSGLDISYPFTVKDSGKARVELVFIQLRGVRDVTNMDIDTKRASGPIPLPLPTYRCPCSPWWLWGL